MSTLDIAKFAPGTLACHEALHMASVLAEMVDERLCQHPSVLLRPDWQELAEKACSALFDLYQVIGQEHMATGATPSTSQNVCCGGGVGGVPYPNCVDCPRRSNSTPSAPASAGASEAREGVSSQN